MRITLKKSWLTAANERNTKNGSLHLKISIGLAIQWDSQVQHFRKQTSTMGQIYCSEANLLFGRWMHKGIGKSRSRLLIVSLEILPVNIRPFGNALKLLGGQVSDKQINWNRLIDASGRTKCLSEILHLVRIREDNAIVNYKYASRAAERFISWAILAGVAGNWEWKCAGWSDLRANLIAWVRHEVWNLVTSKGGLFGLCVQS